MDTNYVKIPLSTEIYVALNMLAKKRGKTVEDLAHDIVRSEVMNENFDPVRYELKQLRLDIAVATNALLVQAGKLTQNEAKEWVSNQIINRA